MRGKDRAALRAEAHHLSATVHIGQQGLSDAVTQSVNEALAARELVKIHLGRNSPIDVKAAASRLAAELGAEVVQVIGRTLTLYRKSAETDGTDLGS